MKTTIQTIITLTLAALLIISVRTCSRTGKEQITERRDTIIIRDTIRDTVLIPKVTYRTRTDTVFLTAAGTTDTVRVEVPVETKVYQTEDYKATIEGYRPSLVGMELYRKTQVVTDTKIHYVKKKTRWGVGIQAGYGYSYASEGPEPRPYIGIGVQYNLVSW